MVFGSPQNVTALLAAWRGGDREALDRLLPEVYHELRRIAHRELARESGGHTLQTTALIHEAYLKLAAQGDVQWQNRAHFFAIAARAMRTILIDYARARAAAKRGGGAQLLPLHELEDLIPEERTEQLLALDEALERLAGINEEACRMVECRYFAGLTLDEVAVALDLSVTTVRRRWDFAKAWLRRELQETR